MYYWFIFAITIHYITVLTLLHFWYVTIWRWFHWYIFNNNKITWLNLTVSLQKIQGNIWWIFLPKNYWFIPGRVLNLDFWITMTHNTSYFSKVVTSGGKRGGAVAFFSDKCHNRFIFKNHADEWKLFFLLIARNLSILYIINLEYLFLLYLKSQIM